MSRTKSFDFKAIRAASTALGEKDRSSEARREFERGERVLVPRTSISLRELNTRELNRSHVERLSESIRVLGLIEPLVVDRKLRLLAGGHRLAAIAHIEEEDPEAYIQWFAGGVPVWMLDLDAEESPDRALSIEIAENEHRRDYTREEARQLADRLRAAGYRDAVGRPKKGEKALGPALAVILGKHLRTIERLLASPAPTPTLPSVERAAMQSTLRTLCKHRKALPQRFHQSVDELIEQLTREMDTSTAEME